MEHKGSVTSSKNILSLASDLVSKCPLCAICSSTRKQTV